MFASALRKVLDTVFVVIGEGDETSWMVAAFRSEQSARELVMRFNEASAVLAVELRQLRQPVLGDIASWKLHLAELATICAKHPDSKFHGQALYHYNKYEVN